MSSSSSFNHKIKISVIIPSYNRAHLVSEAIESALRQTFPPHEIIVVDDGSTDDTASELQKFGDQITYLHQANQGVSAARNLALSKATGDYIAFLDSDDIWDSRKLAVQVEVLEKLPEISLLFTEFGILRQDGSKTQGGTRRWLPHGVDFSELYDHTISCNDLGITVGGASGETNVFYGQVFDRMLHLPYGLLSSSIIRRQLIDDGLRFIEGVSLYEDWEFFARIAHIHTVGFIDMEMTFNRSHRGPERLTLESTVAKTQCYLGVLDRVWKSDEKFVERCGHVLRDLEARALLALARESVLVGDEQIALDALKRWRSLGMSQDYAEAWIYEKCASIIFGSILLRNLLRTRTLLRIITGTAKKGKYSSAPT